MAQAPGAPDLEQDAILGRLAVQRGWISDQLLKEAFEERDRELAAGRETPRAIGNLLVSRGSLTETQLIDLLDEIRLRRTGRSVPPSFGKYRIRRELGRGGMGIVYEAEDSALGRTVALKLMRLASPDAPPEEVQEEEERFLREARLCAGLPHHPGIVGVHDAGVIEGKRFLTMEYIEGKSLEQWTKEASPAREQQIALLREVLLAMHHAHQNGIVHRDLKPQNILVDAEGRPHVVDFGLAKTTGPDQSPSLTASGILVGTPAYMSPEQARGLKSIDHKADLWAAGVVLFEMLSGRLPFKGDSPVDLLMEVVKTPTPPPVRDGAAVRSRRDRDLEDICHKALMKDASDRYPTAQAFADDLGRWLRGERVLVDLPGRKRGGASRIRLTILTALLLSALVAYFVWPALNEAGCDMGNVSPEAQNKPAKPEISPVDVPARWEKAVDLLALIDPEKDGVGGTWSLDAKGLRSDGRKYAGLRIPYDPPEEYDFRIRFIAEGKTPDVNQVLSRNGEPFQWLLGAYGNSTLGFGLYHGRPMEYGPTLVKRQNAVAPGILHSSTLQVRRDVVTGFLDGVQIMRWMSTSDFKLDPRLQMPPDVKLGVTSYECPTLFQSLQLLEIRGRGKPIR